MLSFVEWMEKVDEAINKDCGLTHECIEDWDYYSAYNSGMEPEEAAEEALLEAGLSKDE